MSRAYLVLAMGIILGGILPAISVNKIQNLKREIKHLRQLQAERDQVSEKQIADLNLKKDDLEKMLEDALQAVEVSNRKASSNSEHLEKKLEEALNQAEVAMKRARMADELEKKLEEAQNEAQVAKTKADQFESKLSKAESKFKENERRLLAKFETERKQIAEWMQELKREINRLGQLQADKEQALEKKLEEALNEVKFANDRASKFEAKLEEALIEAEVAKTKADHSKLAEEKNIEMIEIIDLEETASKLIQIEESEVEENIETEVQVPHFAGTEEIKKEEIETFPDEETREMIDNVNVPDEEISNECKRIVKELSKPEEPNSNSHTSSKVEIEECRQEAEENAKIDSEEAPTPLYEDNKIEAIQVEENSNLDSPSEFAEETKADCAAPLIEREEQGDSVSLRSEEPGLDEFKCSKLSKTSATEISKEKQSVSENREASSEIAKESNPEFFAAPLINQENPADSVPSRSEEPSKDELLFSNPGQDSTAESLKQKQFLSGNCEAPSEFAEDCKAACAAPWIQREKPGHLVSLKNEEQTIPYEEALKLLPESLALKISSKNFRERLDGFSLLKEAVEREEISACAVFSFLAKDKFKDANAQVISKMYEVLSSACAWTKTFSLSFAELVFPQCLISLAESKATASIHGFLLEMAECIGADPLQAIILKNLESIKSPKSIQLALNFIAQLLNQFGAKEFAGMVSMIDSIKAFLSVPQVTVRQAAMEFFTAISLQTGSKYEERILDGLNSALCSALKANLKEVADPEYQPTRKNRIQDENGSSKHPAKAKRAAVSMPRELSDLLAEIGAHASDWKIRMKSLESMEKMFRMSGGDCELCAELQANLFKSIAVLLKDSNKNIIGASLKLALSVAENLANPTRARVLIEALSQTVGDSKKSIAQGAEDALLAWVKSEACFSLFAQKFEKAVQLAGAKASLVNILKAGLAAHRGQKFEFLLPSVLLLLIDKSKDVRANAEALIDMLLPELSFEQVMSAMRAFLPQEQKLIGGLLEKKGFKPA